MARTGRKPGSPKTGGRVKGTPNKGTKEIKAFFLSCFEDADYQARVRREIISGELHPKLIEMGHHYAYGKPKDTIGIEGPEGAAVVFTLKLDTPDSDDER